MSKQTKQVLSAFQSGRRVKLGSMTAAGAHKVDKIGGLFLDSSVNFVLGRM